jgi:hypothetical protein
MRAGFNLFKFSALGLPETATGRIPVFCLHSARLIYRARRAVRLTSMRRLCNSLRLPQFRTSALSLAAFAISRAKKPRREPR